MEISQNERDEARRLQSSENSRRVRKEMDLQHHFSSESCRSSTVDHDEEMTLEVPRKRQEVQEVMNETEWKETRGRGEEAWRLEPVGETRTGLKASSWTLMVKATRHGGKLKITEVKVTCQEKKAKKLKVRRENNSGRI